MGGCGLLRVVYSYFEKGCRKNCARDNHVRQGVMVSWYTYKSLYSSLSCLWWPTTVTAKPKTSLQNQKRHGKTKNLTAKTKYLTAKPKPHGKNKILHGKTKNLTTKPNTSQQKQNSPGFAVRYWFLLWSIWFCREVFGFAVGVLVLSWGILFLPWGILF